MKRQPSFWDWLKNLFTSRPTGGDLSPEERRAVEDFSRHLGITLNRPELLRLALTHRSFLHHGTTKGRESNERLEYLGDSVLGLVCSEWLYKNRPHEHEGQLTKTKSLLVSKAILSRRALAMGLGRFVLLSHSEVESGGRQRLSILADTFEAVIGAIYLDQGMDAARQFVTTWLLNEAESILADRRHTNYKSLLQEYVQSHFRTHPVYRIRAETGPDHLKIFTVEVMIGNRLLGEGRGQNKKEAEQSAARDALDRVATRAGARRSERAERSGRVGREEGGRGGDREARREGRRRRRSDEERPYETSETPRLAEESTAGEESAGREESASEFVDEEVAEERSGARRPRGGRRGRQRSEGRARVQDVTAERVSEPAHEEATASDLPLERVRRSEREPAPERPSRERRGPRRQREERAETPEAAFEPPESVAAAPERPRRERPAREELVPERVPPEPVAARAEAESEGVVAPPKRQAAAAAATAPVTAEAAFGRLGKPATRGLHSAAARADLEAARPPVVLSASVAEAPVGKPTRRTSGTLLREELLQPIAAPEVEIKKSEEGAPAGAPRERYRVVETGGGKG